MFFYPHDPAPGRPVSSHRDRPFQAFWMGGFEGADHCNSRGLPLDMVQASGHAEQIEDDHRRAVEAGIRVVRETIGWRLAEPNGAAGPPDLARALRVAASARRHGLQVIWTLMHYGTPPDVSLFDDALCGRLAAFARSVAHALRPLHWGTPIYNVVNEISFTAWAATSTNLFFPYRGEGSGVLGEAMGYAVKQRLVKATLAAMAAVSQVDPRARFLHVEPTIHVAPPRDRPDLVDAARQACAYQWQVWDMLGGRLEPHLGGHPAALDLIGINHYHAGQWEHGTEQRLWWHLRDRRRRRLLDAIREIWLRYRRPMIVAETSHLGEGRAQWLHEVAHDARRARDEGLPLHGICLYPLIDRPDWEQPGHWHRSGLWDTAPATPPGQETVSPAPCRTRRVPSVDYHKALRRWQARLPEPQFSVNQGPTSMHLIVFSHLRWNFVFQRPQHLMSRLSRHYRVVFIEEPVETDGEPYLDRRPQGPDLEVLVPHTNSSMPGFHDEQMPSLRRLLDDFLRREQIVDHAVWLYTPMALPLLDGLTPKAVIYDCMDELSAFLHAPAQLREREAELLRIADLVLAGGPALFEAKRGSNRNVHCVPSSVDFDHYSPARLDRDCLEAQETAPLQQHIAHPRLGFFGVIDERLDLELIRHLAEARPEWQLVLVGPVVKIDPLTLPRGDNIHWLGMQSYARLPHLLAGWDLCLLPFALNDATRFISPTKTLEYMAGGKPIVSTPVRDVVALYGEAVWTAPAGPGFVAACEQALSSSRQEQPSAKAVAAATIVCRSSWEQSAALVHRLIESLVTEGGQRQRSGSVPEAPPSVAGDRIVAAEAEDAHEQT